MLIDRYMRGETHAVSLLHQLAQVLQFHLLMKETVTTGKAPQHVCVHSNSLQRQLLLLLDLISAKTNVGYTLLMFKLQSGSCVIDDFCHNESNLLLVIQTYLFWDCNKQLFSLVMKLWSTMCVTKFLKPKETSSIFFVSSKQYYKPPKYSVYYH